MQTRLYTTATAKINARRPAAQAKRRRRPQCSPEHEETYRYIWTMQDAVAAAMADVSGADGDYLDGMGTGYWIARSLIHKGGDLAGRFRAALASHHRQTAGRLDVGLSVNHDREAGFYAAMADVLARVAPVQAWIEQGYNARIMGMDRPAQATPEAAAWRAGWDLADSLIHANEEETESKPGLDPLPLPAWSELIAAI